ncbi:hypothetical protein ACFV3R_25140 [Streptomyces sp. NPDC059740]|uniref:hypothetical protein n=1 Tax=Streptomyces sp. NPDC059740 TaxID=3346926 RepID=UPI0036537727
MPAGPSKAALAAWADLNDRQQATLTAIYTIEQGIERSRRRAAARGNYDDTPAAIWRRIDFAYAHDFGPVGLTTALQDALAMNGWHSQGNGSTMGALERRGLITQDAYTSRWGRMLTVTLTRAGRAAARAGNDLNATPKAALGRRSWEVLAALWAADQRGEALNWGYSSTIENVLIGKHIPPLAQQLEFDSDRGDRLTLTGLTGRGLGYEITERGRDFYRQQYAAHVAAHPDVRAPHPDGAAAEPWPKKVDELLDAHAGHFGQLRKAWETAHADRTVALKEAAAEPPDTAASLPEAVAAQITARYELWRETARQRAVLADAHVEDLRQRCERAARDYAVAALAAFRAAVAGKHPLEDLTPPTDDVDSWDEERLSPPAETGIHVIDAEAKKLHAAAVGKPLKRRGPAPKRHRRYASLLPEKPPAPGSALCDLAQFLRLEVQGGELLRRLHPGAGQPAAR